MSADRRYRNAAYLPDQYVERGRSAAAIAADCTVTSSTVHRWLARHGIDREPQYRDANWLRRQYVDEARSIDAIAADCDVATSTISYWLGRHDITGDRRLETAECATCGAVFRYYSSVRDGQYCSEDCAHEPTKRQVTVICPNCGTTHQRRASLDTEYCSPTCWSEDLYPNSEQRYAKWYSSPWPAQRAKALKRDGYRCTMCSISEKEHRATTGRGLDVHHNVPVRLFDAWDCPIEDAHSLRNLTTVCRDCHPDAW